MRKVKILVTSFALSLSLVAHANNDSTKPVRDVLQRVIGQDIPNLELTLKNDKAELDWFAVAADKGKVKIEAASLSGLAYGSYQYLRGIGALSASWEGNRVAIPATLPNYSIAKTTSLVEERVYLNVCAYGYTTPFWDWPRWEQEIDLMALHGINSPVAMEGQEYVWKKLWLEFGATEAQLEQYFSGPAFAPWHRMGNIQSHETPISENWINKKHQLQVKMLERMRSLGMSPIVPAFGGYVPSFFKEKFPQAKITKMEAWTGFSQETYWLDPKDPLFNKMAKRFIEIYTETYGASEFYLSDSFNEMLPPVSKENRYAELASYGRAIYDSISQAAPNATWVMQGWMFGSDKKFWDKQSIAAFLKDIPADKVMIHDISNDRYDVWEDANAFFGKPWVFGYIHNYGGSNQIYGDFQFYHDKFQYAVNSSKKGNLRGYGIFPEGINNNSVAYEYMFDVPWSNNQNKPVEDWIAQYTLSRYGKNTPELLSVWNDLNKAVYSTRYWQPRWWQGSAGVYLLFKRPKVDYVKFEGGPSDRVLLGKSIKQLIAMQGQFKNERFYMHDLIDFFRHYVSLHLDSMIQETIVAYQNGDIKTADRNVKTIKKIVERLDLLLGGQYETLASWTNDARIYAETPEDAKHYVANAKKQITTWGGIKLKDYASKAWQGMYKDFYLPRWEAFFDELRTAAKKQQPFDQASYEANMIKWENNWAYDPSLPKATQSKNPIKDMQYILKLLGD